MFNAAILSGTIVVNAIVLNDLSEYSGAVVLPDWIGIGDDINTPEPIVEVVEVVQPISLGTQTL